MFGTGICLPCLRYPVRYLTKAGGDTGIFEAEIPEKIIAERLVKDELQRIQAIKVGGSAAAGRYAEGEGQAEGDCGSFGRVRENGI